MAYCNDSTLIKKPHLKENFSDSQILDIAKCMDPISGPGYFMKNYFYIQHPVQGKLLYNPYNYQIELMYNYHNYRRSISLLGRQLGKTTTACGYLLWYAMFVKNQTILVVANKFAAALEIAQRIRFAYEECPDYIRCGVTSYNKSTIEFDSGSRIVCQATSETSGRGMSISLLYCDELAYVPPNIAKGFWASISPTLSTGGRAIITSTPNSDEDLFALLWKGANKTEDEFGNETELGINGYKAYSAFWYDHPDRDVVWERRERGELGDEKFRREHLCEFIINEETLIAPTTLIDMEGINPIRKVGEVRWYKEPIPGNYYTVSLDPSLGTGGDPSAIQIFEANTSIQIGEWKHNRTPCQDQIKLLAKIVEYIAEKTYSDTSCYYSIENNTLGEAALISLENYGEHNIPGVMLSQPTMSGTTRRFRKGFNTTHKSKIAACSKLKNLVESKRMTINSKSLISELKNFVSSTSKSYAAKPGETDDLVMSTLLAIRMMTLLQDYHTELNNNMSDYQEETLAPMPFVAIF